MAISPTSYDALKIGSAAGTTAEVENVTSLEVSDTKSETTSTYLGTPYASTTTGARTVSIEVGINFAKGDAQLALLESAYDAGTLVFADIITDAGAVGPAKKGTQYPCEVATFSKSFPPDGVITVAVGLRLKGTPTAIPGGS